MSTRSDPASGAFAITPSDDTVIAARALYIGGDGDVALVSRTRDASVVLAGVPGGTILPIETVKVLLTGTTATGIVGLV